jgi:hypothetical protein
MPDSPRIDRAEFLQGAAVISLAAIGVKGLDATWKPKRAFHAVAQHNRACRTARRR